MTAALLLVFILPFMFAISAIVTNVGAITEHGRSLITLQLPPLPAWVAKLPFVGERIEAAWRDLLDAGEGGAGRGHRRRRRRSAWFAGSVGSLGSLFVQFLLTVDITAILYVSGETVGATVVRFGMRLAGSPGGGRRSASPLKPSAPWRWASCSRRSLNPRSRRSVSSIAGIPFAAVLTAVIFILSLAQLGPLPVMAPAVGWLDWSGASGWGTFLLVWMLILVPMDNVLRPLLHPKGRRQPVPPPAFAGVVGG